MFTGRSNEGDDDAMDSFIDEDMEDNLAWDTTAPGSATKKRKGVSAPGFARTTQPQGAFQPGATVLGEQCKPAGSGIIVTCLVPLQVLDRFKSIKPAQQRADPLGVSCCAQKGNSLLFLVCRKQAPLVFWLCKQLCCCSLVINFCLPL